MWKMILERGRKLGEKKRFFLNAKQLAPKQLTLAGNYVCQQTPNIHNRVHYALKKCQKKRTKKPQTIQTSKGS